MLADGAFGHKQPLVDTPADIIRTCDDEREIEAVSSAAEKKEALHRCRQWSLLVQKKKIFLCEGMNSELLDLGLAPKAVRKRVLICLLRDSKVPCVLRYLSSGSRQYQLIGQCYLDSECMAHHHLQGTGQLEKRRTLNWCKISRSTQFLGFDLRLNIVISLMHCPSSSSVGNIGHGCIYCSSSIFLMENFTALYT